MNVHPHSTLDFIKKISLANINPNIHITFFYLDFAKVFDSINHNFSFFSSVGLGDVVELWIEAHLSGRVSRVHAGGDPFGAIQMCNGRPTLVSPLREPPSRCPRSNGVGLCG